MTSHAIPVPIRLVRGVSAALRVARRWPVGALIAALFVGTLAVAAPVERDLGAGLRYFRVHHVPGDLPSAEAMRNHPCVLDLRFATGDAAAADVLRGWLEFHAGAKSLVFVLVNGATDGPLQVVLAQRGNTPGLLTIGIAGQRFAPDITVNDTSANEREAYDRFEKGATVAALTTDHPEKQRNDEASLAHDTVAPESPDADAPPSTSKTGPKNRAAVIDAALQRAIHVHRALRALKKI